MSLEYGADYDEHGDVVPRVEPGDGAQVLDEVRAFGDRFVAWPSEAASVAFTLWCAHAHAVDCFESTPRWAGLSPEPASGKTRSLEVAELLVPAPMAAVNATPAALFRAISDLDERPTILFDEIDTVFGPKAKENEEVRGLLNAGHRRSGVAYRCVGEGTKQKVVAFPAFAAVAVAGLGDLPDTLMTRSVVVRMRRRAPHEHVDSFRRRIEEPAGHRLRDRLAAWTTSVAYELTNTFPDLPDGVTDRPADVWEPLLAIADAAGGTWPDLARTACVELVRAARSVDSGSLGIRLLADLRSVFGTEEALFTEVVLERLKALDEAPWSDLRGKPLDSRGLARRLRDYHVTSHNVRVGDRQAKGYDRADFTDAWTRYLPAPTEEASQPSQRPTDEHPPWSDALFARDGIRPDSRPGTDASVPTSDDVPVQGPSDLHRDGWDGWDGSASEEDDNDRPRDVWRRSGRPA